MELQTSLAILAKVREKKANSAAAFANTVHGMENAQLKADALKDVRNLFLATLGVGMAARGGTGLINLFKQQTPKKTRSGPVMLPLPYPVEPESMPANVIKKSSFLSGDAASTKAGIPLYGPAMMFGGLAGLGLGWKGLDAALDARRKRATQEELDRARSEFHDAMLSQFPEPLKINPGQNKRASETSTMTKVGQALDRTFAKLNECLVRGEKVGFDLSNAGGAAVGGYGMYAGLSSLLAGALVYDKMKKRSQRAVIDKALQRRQRRNFATQPTEIYAIPEPVSKIPAMGRQEQLQLLSSPPEGSPSA